jgi:hypothetical protein
VSAASLEAIDAAVELRLAEHGLDHRLAFAVKLGAAVGREPLAHCRVGAALPAWSGAFVAAGVRRDQQFDPALGDLLHLLVVPVAGIGEHHLRLLGDAGRLELPAGGVEHRFEMPEVG